MLENFIFHHSLLKKNRLDSIPLPEHPLVVVVFPGVVLT